MSLLERFHKSNSDGVIIKGVGGKNQPLQKQKIKLSSFLSGKVVADRNF